MSTPFISPTIQKYLAHYSPTVIQQSQSLLDNNQLADFLLQRHPTTHSIYNDNDLREYVQSLKNQYMKKSSPLSKIIYDSKIHVVHNALGLHSYVSRKQGNKLKSKNELRVSAIFKQSSEALLKMIVVHELAHLKEKKHNKAFYRMCLHMLPNYHQLEFDMRLMLVQIEHGGSIYN
ncbi:MAG: putative metal-dependent hydrolase [Candidatus Endobugula sp.]|jgi:predicted metal-dependent hydrolase